MSSPPTGILSYGWMPGPEPAVQRRDDEALEQWLRDIDHSAAEDPDTLLPPDEVDAPPQEFQSPAAAAPDLPSPSSAHFPAALSATLPCTETSGWSADAQATRRLLVSIALALGLFGMGLALDYLYAGRQGQGAAQHAFEAHVTQMQAAVARGDFAAAAHALGLVGTANADDPRVQAARQAVGQHEQALAQRREHLQEAARRASLALDLHAPDPVGPEPARADDALQIVGAVPPQASAGTSPGACNDALVALALCQPTTTARSAHAP